MRAKHRNQKPPMCPDCRIPLWLRKSKGIVDYVCTKCGQSFDIPKPREFKGLGNGMAAEQLELDLDIGA